MAKRGNQVNGPEWLLGVLHTVHGMRELSKVSLPQLTVPHKKLNIELTYDLVISLVAIYLKELKAETCWHKKCPNL